MEEFEITIGPFNEEKVEEYGKRADTSIEYSKTDKEFVKRFAKRLKESGMFEPICANIDPEQNLTIIALNFIGYSIKKKGEINEKK